MSSTTAAMYLLEDMDSFFCGQAPRQGVRVGSFVESACLYQETSSSRFESGSFPRSFGKCPPSIHLMIGVLQSTLIVIGWTAKRALASGRYCMVICLILQSSKVLASFERQSAFIFSSLGIWIT
ncbi:UNVERIFIED_CONTAM: hypothetical protein Sradi_7080100 [Sesamum radiatum]|uniref:Uncharacterized protein n=1 Tax=Sesamum radiatum TaxID=300843 RepID=A0AAW2J425_SESRA